MSIVTRGQRWLLSRHTAAPEPVSAALTGLSGLPYPFAMARLFREERAIVPAVRAGRDLLGTRDASERVVEVPWVLRRAAAAPTVLDIGTAFSPSAYRRLLARLDGDVTCADINPVRLPGAAEVRADVRALPLDDDAFAVTLCVSTLEHIGMTNEQYAEEGDDRNGDVAALREMGRVTAHDGRVLVTVPGGRARDLGSFRQYDRERWETAVAAAGLTSDETDVFVHDPDTGWRLGSFEEAADRDYAVGAPYAAAVICASLVPSQP